MKNIMLQCLSILYYQEKSSVIANTYAMVKIIQNSSYISLRKTVTVMMLIQE